MFANRPAAGEHAQVSHVVLHAAADSHRARTSNSVMLERRDRQLGKDGRSRSQTTRILATLTPNYTWNVSHSAPHPTHPFGSPRR